MENEKDAKPQLDTVAEGQGDSSERLYFGAYATTAGLQGRTGKAGTGQRTLERSERLRATERSADTLRERRQQERRSSLGNEAADGGAGRDRREPDTDHVAASHSETKLLSDTPSERRGEAGQSLGGCLQRDGEPGEPGDTTKCGSGPLDGKSEAGDGQEIAAGRSSLSLDCGNTSSTGLERQWRLIELGGAEGREAAKRYGAASGATRGFWANCDWWWGRDGKYRPIKPGLFPLAHGAPARVLRLRGYGDGIVAPQAAEFIKAWAERTLG